MAVDEAVLARLEEELGVEHSEELGEVSAILIKRYAAAVGETNPLYTDVDHARSEGYSDVIAPPNFIAAVINWSPGAPYDRLREDGTEADAHLPGVPAKGVRVMGGGEEMTFERAVVAGTFVTRATTLISVSERDSSQGPMLVARYRDVYSDTSGEPLLRTVRTVLLR
jgi:acyl dehydratase